MKCPSCGKELERMKRQVGTTESGDPIFNEYAVCRDCKKQWNLDRQRARKIAAKKEAEQAEAKPVDKAESKVAVRPAESSVSKKGAAEESPAAKKPPVKRSAAGSDAEKVKETEKKAGAKPAKRRRLTDAEGKPVRPKASRPISNDETAEISEKPEKRPVKKKVRPASTEEPLSTKTPGEKKASAKKPVKKRHPEEASDTNKASDEQKYGNIPAEQVRTKREKAVRKGYEEMSDTQYLDIEEDTTILCTKRLRFVDDVPTMIETNHYGKGFSFLEGEDLNRSLYDILQKHKITLGKSIRTLEVVYANAQEASLLNIKKGEALLLFTDKHQDEKGKPLFVSKQVYCTERLKFYL